MRAQSLGQNRGSYSISGWAERQDADSEPEQEGPGSRRKPVWVSFMIMNLAVTQQGSRIISISETRKLRL